MRPIITLLSDFGERDYSVGKLKGFLLSNLRIDANLVDIAHCIEPFRVDDAAYVLKHSYKSFPKNTIHLIAIDIEKTFFRKHLLIYYDGYYFICTDNGTMTIAFRNIEFQDVAEICFDGLDNDIEILAKASAYIANSVPLTEFTKPFKGEINKMVKPNPVSYANTIAGEIIYIDRYGNAISNISKELFQDKMKQHSNYRVIIGSYEFKTIYNSYSGFIKVSENATYSDPRKMALFNANGHLEIAVYKGNKGKVGGSNTLLGIKKNDGILISFDVV